MSKAKEHVVIDFTRAILYPEAKILIIQCIHCNWRFNYAVLPEDRLIQCRQCKKYMTLKELRLMRINPICDTNQTLEHVAGQIARETMQRIIEEREALRKGVLS